MRFLLLLTVLAVNTAYAQKSKHLVGKWAITKVAPADPDNYKESTLGVEQFFTNLRYEFFKDGNVKVTLAVQPQQSGEFSSNITGYTLQKKQLIFHRNDGTDEENEIILFKGDDLHYKSPNNFIFELKREK